MMPHLNKVFIIAKHEFLVTVMRKAFLFTALVFPLFIILAGGIGLLFVTRSVSKAILPPVAIVDRSNILDLNLQKALFGESESIPMPISNNRMKQDNSKNLLLDKIRFEPYTDTGQALAALKQNLISACFVIGPDYLVTGNIAVIKLDRQIPVPIGDHKDQLVDLLRASLSRDKLSGQNWDRFITPAHFDEKVLSQEGEIKPETKKLQKVFSFIGPVFICGMLALSIYTSSAYLLQSITLEKQNRVIEVILSSTEPTELLAGKILGLGAAGLLQSSAYVAIGIPGISLMVNKGIGWLILSLIYAVLGYLVFASLMAATGVIVNCEREGSQIACMWMFISAFPLMILLATVPGADSWAVRIFSFFPLTAPITMIFRIGLTEVKGIDIFFSIISLVISVYFLVRGAAKIFRTASLLYGKRPSLPEIYRWLRQA